MKEKRLNATQDIACPCTGGWTETHWIEAEVRFQQAKQALLDIQQQHCVAAHELLLARAQVRQILEAAFPGEEEVHCSPVSLRHSEVRDGGAIGECNQIESLGKALVSAGKERGADVK